MIDVHLNADLGEGLNIERDIMPFLSSCSIACGGHFGNYNTMKEAAEIAVQNKVKIGAHPSYPDKIGFGRKAMNVSNKELSKSLIQQVNSLREILDDLEYQLDHIKTHGALYNLSANNYDLSMLIIEIISEYYNDTLLYVPSGSLIEKLAIENNINIRKEIFLDRNYNNDNTLVSRTKANAIINSSELMFERINSLINNGYLISAFGKRIFLEVDTFCIHGDSPNILDCLKGLNRLYNAKI